MKKAKPLFKGKGEVIALGENPKQRDMRNNQKKMLELFIREAVKVAEGNKKSPYESEFDIEFWVQRWSDLNGSTYYTAKRSYFDVLDRLGMLKVDHEKGTFRLNRECANQTFLFGTFPEDKVPD